MNKEKPLLSIGNNGIEINLKAGSSIKMNADKIFMKGVKQNIEGGILEQHATNSLTQIDNKMEAGNGGKILNEVTNGTLNQLGNQMNANSGSTIINKVSGKVKTALWVIVIGFLADIASLYFLGKHVWSIIKS